MSQYLSPMTPSLVYDTLLAHLRGLFLLLSFYSTFLVLLMHGRPRQPPRAMTPEELAKIDKYNTYKKMALSGNKKKVYNDATYKLTSSLLTINPDFYTIFNYRKEILLHFFRERPDEKINLLDKEMSLMEEALKTQPKSYYAWYHRVWVIQQGYDNLEKELGLCSQFLRFDSRNFHCWNHRRTVATLAIQRGLINLRAEFDFTTEKINESFSNYSAWHYRSVLLPLLAAELAMNASSTTNTADKDTINNGDVSCSGVDAVDELLSQDLTLCASAFAVGADDQSAWLYHRWLMGLILSLHAGAITPNDTNEENINFSHRIVSSLLPYIPKLHAQMSAYSDEEKDEEKDKTASLSSLSEAFNERFLIGSGVDQKSQRAFLENKLSVVTKQIDLLQNRLLVLEPENKWILTTIAVLQVSSADLLRQAQRMSTEQDVPMQSLPLDFNKTLKETLSQLQKLSSIDPLRSHYYEYITHKLTGNGLTKH